VCHRVFTIPQIILYSTERYKSLGQGIKESVSTSIHHTILACHFKDLGKQQNLRVDNWYRVEVRSQGLLNTK
jgi:hypothetical protein